MTQFGSRTGVTSQNLSAVADAQGGSRVDAEGPHESVQAAAEELATVAGPTTEPAAGTRPKMTGTSPRRGSASTSTSTAGSS
jgi:hypothetical protein